MAIVTASVLAEALEVKLPLRAYKADTADSHVVAGLGNPGAYLLGLHLVASILSSSLPSLHPGLALGCS